MSLFFHRSAGSAALAVLTASFVPAVSLSAQPVTPRDRLVVYVYDVTDGAPLAQATVTFTLEGEAQRRYTDEEGRFFVNVPLSGRIAFEARRIGYKPATEVATLPVPRNRIEINLERTSSTLAKVEVSAGPVFAGIVASSTSQLPIRGARVSMTPGTGRMLTDSMGRFALPTDGRADITLTISARGFAPRLVVDRLPAGESRELVILLDATRLVGNRLYQNLDDRDQRIRWGGTNSGAVGGRELRETAAGLADAFRFSRTVGAKGLVLDDAACLFVDGDPRPGQTLASFPTDGVDLVEFYGARGDYFGGLAAKWPKNQPCGNGQPMGGLTTRVAFVVVWTR
jgi:hypothetical protein